MEMEAAVAEFLADLRAGGSSQATISAYRSHMDRFVAWCKENNVYYLTISSKQIKLFRNYLAKQSLSASTINMHIYALRSFYDYLIENGDIKGNPVISKRLTVAVEKAAPRFLTDEELQNVMDFIANNKPYHVQLAFRTMLATGMRISEVAALSSQDIVVKNGSILAHIRHGKGNKERWAPIIDDKTAKDLLKFKETRKGSKSLFGITASTLKYHARNIKKNTGVDFHSHRLRHTLATNLLAKGYAIDIVQEVLGHENISTTRRYAITLPTCFFQLAAKVG